MFSCIALWAFGANISCVAFRPLFALWPLWPGCTRIAFFALQCGELFWGEICIGERFPGVSLIALIALIAFEAAGLGFFIERIDAGRAAFELLVDLLINRRRRVGRDAGIAVGAARDALCDGLRRDEGSVCADAGDADLDLAVLLQQLPWDVAFVRVVEQNLVHVSRLAAAPERRCPDEVCPAFIKRERHAVIVDAFFDGQLCLFNFQGGFRYRKAQKIHDCRLLP